MQTDYTNHNSLRNTCRGGVDSQRVLLTPLTKSEGGKTWQTN